MRNIFLIFMTLIIVTSAISARDRDSSEWGVGLFTGHSIAGPRAFPAGATLRYRLSDRFSLQGSLTQLIGQYSSGENWQARNLSITGRIHFWFFYFGMGITQNAYFNKEGAPSEIIIFDESKVYYNYLTGLEFKVTRNWDLYFEWFHSDSFTKNLSVFYVGFHYNF